MRKVAFLITLAALGLQTGVLYADSVSQVKKAIERSTLNQPGTKPFHLKAAIAPSFDRDKDSGRTGEVEIWWMSPDKWRREIRSPEFHQIEIVSDGKDWQRNEGDYFPEWLREIAIELINPVPPSADMLKHIAEAERGPLPNQVSFSWTDQTGTPEVHNIQRSWLALSPATGLLSYGGGFGWDGQFKDYEKFHGLMVARTVSSGSPEVTAKLGTLEDLGAMPTGFFDPEQKTGSSGLLRTELIDEVTLRKNLQATGPISWPPLQDGVLEGNITSWILVDSKGKVRETETIVSENSAINEAGREALMNLRFTPFVVNGTPTQAYSQITLPFKTTRPAGREAFDSARNYFDHGRKLSFLTGAGKPYAITAEFQFGGKDGKIETGRYEDTWLSDEQWVRRATFQKSQCARSRNGEKRYRVTEGDQAQLFCLVLKMVEPIPALDTFYESDWRIRRDAFNGTAAIRVASGYESPEGKLDQSARSYWFDDSGVLLKTFFTGIETHRSDFQEFNGIKFAHQIDVLKDGQLAMRIKVTSVSIPGDTPAKGFELKGHEWQRAFTDEVR